MPTHKITLTRAQVSDLFRHAAELMEVKLAEPDVNPFLSNYYKFDFSCHALDRALWDAGVGHEDQDLIHDEYARMFKPAKIDPLDSWFGPGNDEKNDRYRKHRVQALLLAAEAHELGRR